MCSFLVTNKKDINLDALSIRKMQQRGPDGTTFNTFNGITIIHNLLHVTGETSYQPLTESNALLVYNGEIYNYDTNLPSDGYHLLKNFKQLKDLDGEYAGVYLNLNNSFIFSDTFGTKPIFYSYENGYYAISSFYDVVKKLGFKNVKKAKNNTILDLQNDFEVTIAKFNLDQIDGSFDKWEKAFLDSVYKRIKKDKTFICLSSGYDSGALALASKILGIDVKMYTIPKNENIAVINEREKILGKLNYIDLDLFQINKHLNLLKKYGDGYVCSSYNYKEDLASVGLSVIIEQAKKEGEYVLLSGAGADEVMSDYGIEGRDIFGNSSLCGIFPKNLHNVFPWKNFFNGRQEMYLYKEESVSGIHGIESRYPFLDKKLVQSFLNTSVDLKNSSYKAPLEYLFNKYKFPYEKNIKRGFKIE